MTVHIHLDDVELDYPILSQSSRRLGRQLINVATGGQLDRSEQGRITVRALTDITLRLEVGDRVGLIGHNGSGKSTLLKLLGGIYRPTSGTVSRAGVVGSLLDISLGMSPDATGRENIFLRGALQGMSRSEIARLVPGIIEFSELGDFIELPMRTYSSGMLLRLAFSVATVLSPDILLMDEWLSVGDEAFQSKAEARLHEVVSRTSILVIASHSANLISGQCNRVLYLDHGRLIADGPPAEVLPMYFAAPPEPQ
ncbi:MAG TPA: ABC transporter ATP-binding protein [Rhodoglobus sp.]|jgi:lipopolysaccharide transport system ATP-binding protein|nr:ABC transporter ATP-binding protein [Rhodoglobus sp.]HPU02630.1 ABC transporter ATP-binding protein [Rhodoglobus sp.]HQG69115.1 ABC transporter ATP-binding protein [Rhodoglobus sp.]HQJ33554.1 ABC transporter ATP-binding protein [Rhodoglobus sp.]